MTKFFPATAVALLLGMAAGVAGPADAATSDHAATAATATTQRAIPTDLSAARRHYRYVRNRWRVAQPVQPYPSYGYYGPRPHLYRPYPYYMPLPFGFGFGFDPYYW